MSARWVTLWVRPRLCVHSFGNTVGLSPLVCVCSFGYIVGASPLCVSVQLVTLWVRTPLVYVLSLEDDLRWILACCLLRFAAFLMSDWKVALR